MAAPALRAGWNAPFRKCSPITTPGTFACFSIPTRGYDQAAILKQEEQLDKLFRVAASVACNSGRVCQTMGKCQFGSARPHCEAGQAQVIDAVNCACSR